VSIIDWQLLFGNVVIMCGSFNFINIGIKPINVVLIYIYIYTPVAIPQFISIMPDPTFETWALIVKVMRSCIEKYAVRPHKTINHPGGPCTSYSRDLTWPRSLLGSLHGSPGIGIRVLTPLWTLICVMLD